MVSKNIMVVKTRLTLLICVQLFSAQGVFSDINDIERHLEDAGIVSTIQETPAIFAPQELEQLGIPAKFDERTDVFGEDGTKIGQFEFKIRIYTLCKQVPFPEGLGLLFIPGDAQTRFACKEVIFHTHIGASFHGRPCCDADIVLHEDMVYITPNSVYVLAQARHNGDKIEVPCISLQGSCFLNRVLDDSLPDVQCFSHDERLIKKPVRLKRESSDGAGITVTSSLAGGIKPSSTGTYPFSIYHSDNEAGVFYVGPRVTWEAFVRNRGPVPIEAMLRITIEGYDTRFYCPDFTITEYAYDNGKSLFANHGNTWSSYYPCYEAVASILDGHPHGDCAEVIMKRHRVEIKWGLEGEKIHFSELMLKKTAVFYEQSSKNAARRKSGLPEMQIRFSVIGPSNSIIDPEVLWYDSVDDVKEAIKTYMQEHGHANLALLVKNGFQIIKTTDQK
jgi:hypothetical protein